MNLVPCIFAFVLLYLVTDWPQFGGPDRNFRAPENSQLEKASFSKISEKWTAQLGEGNSGIVVQDRVAFTCFREENEEHVVAISISDGAQIWKRSLVVEHTDLLDPEFGAGPHSTPIVSNGMLFFAGVTGQLVALDAKDGSLIWHERLWSNDRATKLERGFSASPVAYKDTIIVPVGGEQQSIQCFSMENGKLRWKKQDFKSAYSSPLIARLGDRFQLIILMDQVLVGMDPETGDLLWKHSTPSTNFSHCTSPLATEDGMVFVSTAQGIQALKVENSSGKFQVSQLWSSRFKIGQTSNFVIWRNVLYGSKTGGIFVAIDARTGATRWQSRSVGGCSLLHAGENFVTVEENGRVCMTTIGETDLDIKWEAKPLTGRCWAGPAVTENLIFVRDNYKLIALEFRN